MGFFGDPFLGDGDGNFSFWAKKQPLFKADSSILELFIVQLLLKLTLYFQK